jgi:predicted acetylornithine/succinylornithine family transaminase
MKTNEVIALDKKYVMNTYARLPVVFVKGSGTHLWDADGKDYLDFIGGIGVAAVGHAHPYVVEAIQNQASELIHVSNLFYTEPQAVLAEKLIDMTYQGKVFFANSGAEANEAAIKLARKYARDADLGSYVIMSAEDSFHGRTLATLAATGQPKKHEPFKPMPSGFIQTEFNNIKALEDAATAGLAAIMLEVVQGESGIKVADYAFVERAREICDKSGALLIIDEIQSGMGRTGKIFAFEHYDVDPDIITIAKGLGGGMPIGAVIASKKVHEVFAPGDHGTTFGGSPIACSAALAAIRAIEDEDMVENAATMGSYLVNSLNTLRQSVDCVDDVRGLGLMAALELNVPQAGKVVLDCLERGLVINKTSETTLRFLPPLNITRADVDNLMTILAASLEAKC